MPQTSLPAPSLAPGPLADLRVLEIGDESGEYAGQLLAGLGAHVLKVEGPEGSPSRRIGPYYHDVVDPERSLHFWAYNRGKSSIVLETAKPQDVHELRSLLASADVLVDSGPRGWLSKCGLDLNEYPALIHARLSPFGDSGPWSDYKTSDLVSLALGGVVMNCGYDPQPDGYYDLPPIAPQSWHSFHIAGEQVAIGVLGALISRVRSGRGQQVSVNIHEAVAKNTEQDIPSWIMLRQEFYRQTCRHAKPEITEPGISYTKDGRWMLAISLGGRDRQTLRSFMGRYSLGEDIRESATVDADFVRAVGGSTAAATADNEVIQRLTRRFTYDTLPWREAQDAGLLWSPIRKPHENCADPHWVARGTFANVKHADLDESLQYPIGKWISTAGSWTAGRPAPRLGQSEPDRAEFVRPLSIKRRVPETPDAVSVLHRPLPLQGVRVLDFTWFLASAGSTRFLASLGADVLKVEWKTHPDSGRGALIPEGGREARNRASAPLRSLSDPAIGGQFNNKNPGKRGLSLNVADPRGLEIAKALVPHCDIVAEGFSPGVMERWGLGYDVLRTLRSDVIYVKQSGMGSFGTYGRFRCLGPTAAALSGVSEMSGLPEPAPPAGWGYSYLDWFGAYSMALSMLTALYHREQTGEGQWIDASQTEVGIMLTAVPILDWAANGRPWQRVGNRSPFKPAAPHGVYRCAGDDRWIAISCFDDKDWNATASVAGHSEWLGDARFATLELRLNHQNELDDAIESWTSQLDAYGLMDALQAKGVAAGVCQTAEDRYERDPQLNHLKWLTEIESTQLGRWPIGGPAIHFSETPAYVGGLTNRGAPLYGEDNNEILGGLLGMTDADIDELRKAGVV